MATYRFNNEQPEAIAAAAPNQISSRIEVSGVQGQVMDLNVKLDVTHTFTGDLRIRIIGPTQISAFLVLHRGGSGDNFENTVFDDQADTSISQAQSPFRGEFRPEDALTAFNQAEANGLWTLDIIDNAIQDGGSLNFWELELVTDHDENVNSGTFLFHNRTPLTIASQQPNSVESEIEVSGLDGATVKKVVVTLNIEHSYTSDLKITLLNPNGMEVLLVDREGAHEDDFIQTSFDDEAGISITGAQAPFQGAFRPEGPLSDFQGSVADGTWKLRIEDQASFDGGRLQSWTLSIETGQAPAPADRPFQIQIQFLGGLTDSQQTIFREAADRWAEVIIGNLPSINTDIGLVDDLVIDAEGIVIDDTGGILGQAGPTQVRPGSLLPARGIMQFDAADIQNMENQGELLDVAIHEIGHVLGIGSLWDDLGLIAGAGTDNPLFLGTNAMREYGNLRGLGPTPVPIANTGGPGTREVHWRESVFDDELMTGYDDPGRNALSRITIASVQDLGYQVNYQAADVYFIPFSMLSSLEVDRKKTHRCNVEIPPYEILSNIP